MSKEFISFLPDITVGKALAYLKDNKPQNESSHNIYLANNRNKLIGMVTLFDIIVSETDNKLYDLMTENQKSVKDEDKIDKVMEVMQKYNLLEIPVVDESNELVGITSLNDIINEYIRLGRIPA